MNILSLITGNAARGPQTLRFPGRQAPAAQYRGNVTMDPAKCLACGICDYVCVSRAISLTQAEDRFVWSYDPARCTYCGRCADHCPAAAITQAADRGPSYGRPGELSETVTVVYPLCPDCGKPARPFNEALLRTAFADVSAELRERAHLCERCRQKEAVSALKKGFGAVTDRERSDDGR
jgi:ferredoxin